MKPHHLLALVMRAKRCRRMGLAVAALAMLCGAQGAWAGCERYPGAQTKFITLDMGRIVVPADLAVNAPIATRSFAIPVNGVLETQVVCPSAGSLNYVVPKGSAIAGGSKIYSTDVVGVGIRLSVSVPGFSSTVFPWVRPLESGAKMGVYYQEAIVAELIKTAAVTGSGPLAAGTYLQVLTDEDNFSVLIASMSANGTTLVTPSCVVDLGSRNIPVAFDKVPLSSFKGQGSTAVDRSFNIRLNCNAAQNPQYTVRMRMDAQADPSNAPGVLRLTQGGTATAGGVGIQVVDGTARAPVKFGDDVVIGPLKDGSYVLPYTAHYYQTGSKVTPGQANGMATFTLSYK
ncbi:fimbrial protein [Variovorax boronicumulans]|uniref:fimbrial protein n=1 Tax=Variovorax boronicumulans TaxID=436515 RepID=UPI00214BEEE6